MSVLGLRKVLSGPAILPSKRPLKNLIVLWSATMSQPPIYYFDNNATTRIAPEVVDAMLPFLSEFGEILRASTVC